MFAVRVVKSAAASVAAGGDCLLADTVVVVGLASLIVVAIASFDDLGGDQGPSGTVGAGGQCPMWWECQSPQWLGSISGHCDLVALVLHLTASRILKGFDR